MPASNKRFKASPAQRALVLRAQGEMGIEEVATVERVPPDHVRVRIVTCGLCASDDHYLRHGRIGNFKVDKPMVLGHEVGGVVTELGDDVTDLHIGDKVAIEPGIACEKCTLCKGGQYNLCPDMSFFATPPVDGALRTEIVHPARLCFNLPPPLTTEHGALCEPLSVAVYGELARLTHTSHAVLPPSLRAVRDSRVRCNLARPCATPPDTMPPSLQCAFANTAAAVEGKAHCKPGQVFAVFGCGPIGVLVALAVAANDAHVVVVDMNPERLAALKVLLPTAETLMPCASAEETAAAIREAAARIGAECPGAETSEGVAASIDCTGAEPCLRAGIFAARSGGVLVMVGLGRADNRLPTVDAITREIRIEGCFRYRSTWPRCIELMEAGRIPSDALITHRFAFTDEGTHTAFDTFLSGQGPDGNAVVKCVIKLADEAQCVIKATHEAAEHAHAE